MIPLNELIDKETNVYEMTCVAIKEADIYAQTDKGAEIEAAGGQAGMPRDGQAVRGDRLFGPVGERGGGVGDEGMRRGGDGGF